jgi:hypothetical protein
MDIGNRLRRKLNRPIKFNHELAINNARLDGEYDLRRLHNRAVLAEVEGWIHAEDPITDGIACDSGIENADMEPGSFA